MYEPKQKIKTVEEVRAGVNHLQIMQAMGMTREERRAISKANKGLKIPGSNKPVVNIKKK